VIRTRRPGDRICPFGCAGSRKLQDYLTDRKIPEPFRDTIPLLCRNDEVMLVCGVGAGNIPRWDAEKQSVRLTWIGDIPWMA
jgi:tRNA(Ile)-lysidine synthase